MARAAAEAYAEAAKGAMQSLLDECVLTEEERKKQEERPKKRVKRQAPTAAEKAAKARKRADGFFVQEAVSGDEDDDDFIMRKSSTRKGVASRAGPSEKASLSHLWLSRGPVSGRGFREGSACPHTASPSCSSLFRWTKVENAQHSLLPHPRDQAATCSTKSCALGLGVWEGFVRGG